MSEERLSPEEVVLQLRMAGNANWAECYRSLLSDTEAACIRDEATRFLDRSTPGAWADARRVVGQVCGPSPEGFRALFEAVTVMRARGPEAW